MTPELAVQAEATFQQALALHQQSRLDEARALYEQTLQWLPRHAHAWHLLGIVALQSQQLERARELIENAISVESQIAEFHNSLGNALALLHRHEAAIPSYEESIALKPDVAETHFNLGNALYQTKRHEAAVASYEKAVALKSDYADAYNNRGLALAALRRYAAALASYDEAIALKVDFALAYSNRGLTLKELDRFDEALLSYDRAIALKADFAEAHSNRGLTLKELNRFEAALLSYDRAIALKGDFAEAHSNRGLALKELNRFDEALFSYDRAIALKLDFAEAYSNRGLVRQDRHQLEAALADFSRAIALKPDFAVAYFNRAMASLMVGDYQNGWQDYEWRWKGDNGPIIKDVRYLAQPCWLGRESIAGKTLLLHNEQGLGDTIQFCRYAKWVADCGARVILEVQQPLHRLLVGVEGVSQVVTQGDPRPAFDYYCPLMSLPLAFKTTLATLPARTPYIKSDPQKALYWRERLGAKTKLRVGLVWSGGFRAHQPELWAINDRRNVPLSKFASLKHPQIEFYSLQKGRPAESEPAQLLARHWDGPHLADFAAELGDFTDTAALLEQLDLLISVDTSTAHLAGAMGKPVWILNRFDACWRWLLDRTDSPWYPSARLYRQESAGDWDGVIQRVRSDLHAQVRAGSEVAVGPKAQ
jgi:tetratricopeptide (TPR) repeat protein